MVTDPPQGTSKPIPWNLPNQLTIVRLVLAVVLFCFIAYEYYLTGLVLFIVLMIYQQAVLYGTLLKSAQARGVWSLVTTFFTTNPLCHHRPANGYG